MGKAGLVLLLVISLAACNGWEIPLLATQPPVSPSPPPEIISPTPVFPASTTFTSTRSFTSTMTQTLTMTPIPVFSPVSPLGLELLGCNTSLDITHGMGEVTNAYPLVQNRSTLALTNLCATLSASDEARVHPDKTACIPLLPPGDQVTLKLTVDTGFKQDTSIQVSVTTDQGLTSSASRLSCRDLRLPGWVPVKVGLIEPIP